MTDGARELFRVYGRVAAGGRVHDAPAGGWPERMRNRPDCGSGVIVHPLFELADLSADVGTEEVFFLLAEHNVSPKQLCAACYPIRTRARYAVWIKQANAGEIDLNALAVKHGRPVEED